MTQEDQVKILRNVQNLAGDIEANLKGYLLLNTLLNTNQHLERCEYRTASTGYYTVYTRFIFCFGGFVFVPACKNVFGGVFRFIDFAVSLGTGALNRKLHSEQNERQRQKHFHRQQKNEKRQHKKCFQPKTLNFV